MARRKHMTRVKAHRTYTVKELTEVADVTAQTIRAWRKQGLPIMTDCRPYLILGADAKAFEARKLADSAHPLQPGEFFCFRCKAPRKPAFGLVTYNPLTPYRGFLTAFCEDCEADCRRFIGRADLPAWGRLCRIDGTIVPQD